MFEIKNASFIKSCAEIEDYLTTADEMPSPEICMVGRSNVGKSSLINMMTGRNKLAKTSATPGRTRLINLFDINDGQLTLVDLPGYGYAAAAKSEQYKWSELAENYLENSQRILRVFVLLDCRHAPSKLDMQMISYLYTRQLPFTIIATKCDKLSRSQLFKAMRDLAAAIGVGTADIIAVSSTDKKGRDTLLDKIGNVLENAEL